MCKDDQYQIALEYCGYATPKYIVRFCGEWLGVVNSKIDGHILIEQHNEQRFK